MPRPGIRLRSLSADAATGLRAAFLLTIFSAILFAPAGSLRQRIWAQELDETRRRIPLRAQLVWDNVTDTVQVVAGKRPKHSVRCQLDTVQLEPGESTEFLVPAHQLVRVLACDGSRLHHDEIEIWTSNGSGLYRKQNPAFSSDGCSMIAAPDQSGPSVARVTRRNSTPCSRTIALFTSRRAVPKLLDYYQCPILNCGDPVEISDDQGRKSRQYWYFPGGTSYRLRLDGPTRLRLEARLKYGLDVKQRQTFWLQVYVNGVLDRVLSFDTLPQRQSRVFVDGCERLVGRREFAYLDLDCGDQVVELRCSHAAYLRADGVALNLCRDDCNRNFDFPTWENMQKAVSIWDAPQFDPTSSALGQSFLDDGEIALPIEQIPLLWNPYINQQRIQGLARNNRIPHSGLRAYMWMRAIASLHYGDADFGDEIDVPEMAQRIRERYTFFRDLLPAQLQPQHEPRRVAFHNRQIRKPTQKLTETIVGEQHVPEAVGSLPKTTLVRLPLGLDRGIEYSLPASLGNSLIRLAVDQTHLKGPARLLVQFDHRPPIEVDVMPKDVIKPLRFVPGRPAAALSALAAVHERYDSGTAGGPFAMWCSPVPVVRAATAEFLKPATATRMRIAMISCGDPAVHLGVGYLDARKVRLSETSYRYLSTMTEHEQAESMAFRFANQELDNNSLGLERLLQAHHQQFASSVQRSDQVDPATELWDQTALQELENSATQFVAAGQWPEALEALTEIIKHSDGPWRQKAVLARADALYRAGEEFLGNRELRGWLRFSEDPQLRYAALNRLLERDADHDRLREQYLAFAGVENRDDRYELALARQLMKNGRYEFALLLLSSLIANDENRELLLRCSYQTGWWRLFDETLKRTTDPTEKNFWKGLKELHLGRYTHAEKLLRHGGQQGQVWLDHWKSGDRIFKQLMNPSPKVRLRSIGAWEQWQADHPGPRKWVAEPAAVKSAPGTITTYSPSRDLRATYFAANPGAPAVIQIHGPVRLKIEARPIHQAGSAEPIVDWLQLDTVNDIKRVPISNNYPSESLTIQGDWDRRVGALVTAEIELPAGLNRLRVFAAKSSLAVRVLASRPEIASPVLPPINETTLATVIKGSFGRHQHRCDLPACGNLDCIRMTCRDRKCQSVPLTYFAVPCGCNELHTAVYYFNKIKFGDAQPWQDRFLPVEAPLSVDGYDAVWTEATEAAFYAEANAHFDRQLIMPGIIRVAELAGQYPDRPDLQRLLRRIKSGTSWEQYRQFDSRAGVHVFEVSGWQPETPELRIRRSLLPRNSQCVLTGSNQLTLSVHDPEGARFQVSMRRPRLGFLPMGKTVAVLESNASTQAIELGDPDQRTQVQANLTAGADMLEISHGNPLANHFIYVDLRELSPAGQLLPADDGRAQTDEAQRVYQVATEDDPLKFRVAGPALLRIDQYSDGVVVQRLVPVESDQQFVLTPPPGREMSMFRIFEMRLTEPTPTYRPAKAPLDSYADDSWHDPVVQSMYEQVETPEASSLDALALLPPDLEPLPISLTDREQLGLQNRGTWSGEVGYRRRIAVEENPNKAAADQFMELIVARHFYDQWTDRYLHNDLIVRPRFDSGWTLGLVHEGGTNIPLGDCTANDCADGWGPIQFRWKGAYYHQFNAATKFDSASPNPYSLNLSGSFARKHFLSPLLHHWMTVQFFGRDISEDDNGYRPGAADLDVFTQYKSDHRFGVRFSDRWIYQRCLDRRWWVRPSLMSNEDEWVPDNLGFQVGTDQLLGPLQLRLSYRLTGYFDDDDRIRGSVQNVLYVDLMLERWHSRWRRSELRFSMRNELDNGRTSIGFNLVNFLNAARGYRDFYYRSTLFRAIRQERAAKQYFLHR